MKGRDRLVVLISSARKKAGALARFILNQQNYLRSMKTKSTSLFIAVAAFAVTASGVHAFSSPELLIKAGLSEEQVVAVQEAQELKATGDMVAAKQTLAAAGITEETMQHIREVAKEAKQAVKDAVADGDYETFKRAIVDSPLEDLVTTEADFNQFVEAHELRRAGNTDAAAVLAADLGIDQLEHKHKHHNKYRGSRAAAREQLTDEQREALQIAHKANDKDAVRAIFAEAGIELKEKGKRVR